MSLVSFLDPSGAPVAVSPANASKVSEVPGVPGTSHIDLADPSHQRVTVVGAPAAVVNALMAPGEAFFAVFAEFLTATLMALNVARVAAVYPGAGFTFVDLDDPSLARVAVVGTQAATLAALAAAVPPPLVVLGGTYPVVLNASGGGVVAPVGLYRFERIGTVVRVMGSFSFIPLVGGVPEFVDMNLPPFAPVPSPFANVQDVNGLGAADLVTTTLGLVLARVATTLVEIEVDAAGGTTVAVVFDYETI